jgi:adenine-specific DNA-methyltransferase
MTVARRKLLENFDDEVREKLKVRDQDTGQHLERFERQLMRLTAHELDGAATFINGSSFRLDALPDWVEDRSIPTGLYELPRRSGEAHLFRLNHPLGGAIVARALQRELPIAELVFDYSAYDGRISVVEPFVGRSGWLTAALLTIDALGQSEDHLLVAGQCDDGTAMGEEALRRLLTVNAEVGTPAVVPDSVTPQLDGQLSARQDAIRRDVSERNARFFEMEATKLDGWADDLKVGLEREIKELDRQIKEARKAATVALTLEEKLAGQKAVKALEAQRSAKRRSLFDAQDKIDAQRAELIAQIEAKLVQQIDTRELFTIRWSLR